MTEFTATTADLKKALSIVSLATGDSQENIHGHALFSLIKDTTAIALYATDNDKMAASYLPVSNISSDGDLKFTADPKRLQTLITNADSNEVKFGYDKETKTVSVHVSENSESFVSFASFDPDNFLTFDKDIAEATKIKVVDATVLISGIKFIQGFISDDSNKKYSNLFIMDGTMYGSNGSNSIGAFTSTELAEINVSIRRQMLAPIGAIIEKTGSSEIVLLETDKLLMVSTVDRLYSFAFRKTTTAAPKLPISTDIPDTDGFNIDRTIYLKKLHRLSLASREEVAIKMQVSGSDLTMETVADRKSRETISCRRLVGEEPLEFLLECIKFKTILNFFQASNLDIYIDKTKCTVYSKAELLIEEKGKEPVKKEFTAVGLVTLAKVG
jgi:hypothetical protein